MKKREIIFNKVVKPKTQVVVITPTILSIGTTNSTAIRVIFSENVALTLVGWSFTLNGNNLPILSVSGSGTTWTFIVDPIEFGDVVLYSYNKNTGDTKNITNVELNSVTNGLVINNIPGWDVDAQTYLDVIGVTDVDLSNAIHKLVIGMKQDGTWSKSVAIYPMMTDKVNLLTYTENFGNAQWSKSALTATLVNVTAPDSSSTCYKLIPTGTNAQHYATNTTGNPINGDTFTYSVYVKPGGYNWVRLVIDLTTSFCRTWFDVQNGVIGVSDGTGASVTNAVMTNVGNGWYRCQLTFTSVDTHAPICWVAVANGDNVSTFTGDGTSGIYAWGAQLEYGLASTYEPCLSTSIMANQMKYNLKDPRDLDAAHRIVWSGISGWSPNGVHGYVPNSAFGDTKITPSTHLQQNSVHLSYYNRHNAMSGLVFEMGLYQAAGSLHLAIDYSSQGMRCRANSNSPTVGRFNPSTLGHFMVNRTNSTQIELYSQGTLVGTENITSDGLSSLTLSINCLTNTGFVRDQFSTKECAFATVGAGFTSTEAGLYRNRIEKFQQRLFRSVVTPPSVLMMQALNTTTIAVTFSEAVNVITSGWSFKRNGSTLTINSVSGTGSLRYFTVDYIDPDDVITYTYDSSTGNTLNGGSIEMVSVTDQPVTNSITPWDADAKLFMTATGMTSIPDKTKINNLVLNLKSASLWSKMKAVYPFIGGTANKHKYNLKDPRDLDAAYRLQFNGTWTHDANGLVPNGVNAYANTFYNQTANGNVNSNSFGVYYNDSSSSASNAYFEGAANAGTQTAFGFYPRAVGNYFKGYLSSDVDPSTPLTTTDMLGLRSVSRTSSIDLKNQLANTISSTTRNSINAVNYNLYLGARNLSGTADKFNPYRRNFAFIGEGLNNTELTNLEVIVDNYEASLGRNAHIIPTVSSANTASTTTITIVFSESVTLTSAGWSFKKNGSNLAISSVSGSGNTWTFTVATMSYGNTLSYSYDSTTGNTLNVDNNELVSVTDVTVTNNILLPAPVVTSATTANTTSITIVFDQTVTLTSAGWSFKKNGSNLAISSVSGSGNTWTFVVGSSMVLGDVLLYSYDSTTGNTLNLSSVEMVSVTNISVTNTISSPAPTLVSAGTNNNMEVIVVFSEPMNITTAGWSLNNGSSVAINSVSGTGTTWTFQTGYMNYGETITISYDSSTGNSKNLTNIEIVTFTNTSVTNNILDGEFTILTAAFISAAVYVASDSAPKRLLRTLWVAKYCLPGKHRIYWNGKTDKGVDVISSNDYEIQILNHTISGEWHTVGNSATSNHGMTTFAGYSRMIDCVNVGNICFWGRSWDEGGSMALVASDRSIDINVAIPILFSLSGPRTNVSFEYLAANSTYVFVAGVNPQNGDSLVYAIKHSDFSEAVFTGGSSYNSIGGRIYASVLNLVTTGGVDVVTGIACDNNYLYVARGTLNTIDIHDISGGTPTGNILSTITTYVNPRHLKYDASNGGRLWLLHGTNSMEVATIGTLGALTTVTHAISDFPSNMVTMAINGSTLAVAVGGSEQRVWRWNISAATPSGTYASKFGQIGGYSSTSLVTNDRFLFTDYSTGAAKGLDKPYLAYDASGRLYVGDVGNNRCQIFNSSDVYQQTVMEQPAVYQVGMNLTNATKGYIKSKEFTLNLDGTWALYRNFDAQITTNYMTAFRFQWVATLSNGRTYATLTDDITTYPPNYSQEIVEISDTGVRYTGLQINEYGQFFGNFLDKEFTIWNIYSASYLAGQTPILRKKTITSFDGSNNPVYSSWTTVMTFPPIAADDAMIEGGNGSLTCITDSGIVVIMNSSLTITAFYHIQGYDINTGNKIWGNYIPTTRAGDIVGHLGYRGKEFPNPHYYERGNSVNTNTFSGVKTANNLIFLVYNGENWKGSQCNYVNAYDDKGLVVNQYGTDRISAEAIEIWGIEASGNSNQFEVVAYDNDTAFMVQSDEGSHGAMQYRIFKNINDITYRTIPILPPTSQTLLGNDLLVEVVFNTNLVNTSHITISDARDADYIVASGITSYEIARPDISIIHKAVAYPSQSKTVTINVYPAYNPALKYYTVFGQINFNDFSSNESTNVESSFFQLVDNAGLIIAQISLGVWSNDFLTRLRINNYVLIATADQNITINKIIENQDFEIIVNSLGCVITYADYDPVFTPLHNPSADWSKPTDIKLITKSTSSIIGQIAIGVRELRYYESMTNAPAPQITDLTTISSNEVQITFDQLVTATTAGFTMMCNSSPLTINSISGADNVWILNVADMIVGDVLDLSYASSTGNTVNSNAIELNDFSNVTVTNTLLAPSYSVLTYVNNSTGSFILDIDAPSFNCQANKYLEVGVWNYGYITCSSVTDTAGNTYVLIRNVNGFSTWKCENCLGNATNVVTAHFTSYGSCAIHVIQSGGIALSSPTAFTAEGDSTANATIVSDPFTTLQSNQAVTCFSCINTSGATWTAPSGYTDLGTDALGRINASYILYTSIQTGITISATTTGFTDDKYQSIIGKKLA